ncbi:MAG: hypothetical protein KDK70_03370 [Myxococcales bacterium]|nr:hypothetical protein [Myxococcales bacterium]
MKTRRATLWTGRYRAQQQGDKVVVFAEGQAPTPNTKVWLQFGPERIFPPIIELWQQPPPGLQIQLMTPFSVHTSFVSEPALETVMVRDAEGRHAVAVEQLPAPDGPPHEPVEPSLANVFHFTWRGQAVAFTRANIAGLPLLSVGERQFMGDQIAIEGTKAGELVSVVLEAADQTVLFALVLPPTYIAGWEQVEVETMAMRIYVRHRADDGPAPGPAMRYEPELVQGTAGFIVS